MPRLFAVNPLTYYPEDSTRSKLRFKTRHSALTEFKKKHRHFWESAGQKRSIELNVQFHLYNKKWKRKFHRLSSRSYEIKYRSNTKRKYCSVVFVLQVITFKSTIHYSRLNFKRRWLFNTNSKINGHWFFHRLSLLHLV